MALKRTAISVVADDGDQTAICLNTIKLQACKSPDPLQIALLIYDSDIEWLVLAADCSLQGIAVRHSDDTDGAFMPLPAKQLFFDAKHLDEELVLRLKTRLAVKSSKLKRKPLQLDLNHALRYVARCMVGARLVALHHSLDGIVDRMAVSKPDRSQENDAKSNLNPQTLFKCQVNICLQEQRVHEPWCVAQTKHG